MSTEQPQLSEACCNTPPTEAVYQHQGEDKVLPVTINGENLKTYRTGPKKAKIGIIGAYDVWGFTPTTYRFYDTLARSHGGYQISIPHYYKKENLRGNAMPDVSATMRMLFKYGSYKESHVDEMILAAIEDLRADGCQSFVMYGQCWGGRTAVQAAGDERMPLLGTGGVHPSLITQELISKARCPLILMPAKDNEEW
ncbi:hypothetical protein BGZ72_007568 [Mortierella alpina]|nr:hypothetical protein BGZ72_007568 [Mortierella alpina]